jgi:hypothetical protein
LETWQSNDGAPRVDYCKSDLKNNIIVMTGRPPVLLRPDKQQNMPKTKFIDKEVSESSGQQFIVKNNSEDEEDEEEESEEEAPKRHRSTQKQGPKGKGKAIIIEDELEHEAPKSKEAPKSRRTVQKQSKQKGNAIVIDDSGTESEELPRKKSSIKKRCVYLISVPSPLFINHSLPLF